MIRLPPQNTIQGKTENPFVYMKTGGFVCILESIQYFIQY